MSEQGHLFTGDLEKIGEEDIDAPIATAREPSCEYYSDPFANAAKSAEESGDKQLAAVYRFIHSLVCFHPTYDTPTIPYGPWIQMEGKRSPIPSDLSSLDIDALQRLAPLAKDPALRARLFDLIWILKKDHKACAEAADCYVAAASRINTPESWPHAAPCFQRALQLAAKLGRDKELFQRVSEAVQAAVRKAALDAEAFRVCKYLRLIQQHWCGDPAEFALIAEKIAQSAEAAGDPYRARAYWEAAAALRHNAKDQEAERRNRLAAAETYVSEAEKRTTGQLASALAASSFLSNGIEALRRAAGSQERIKELRKRLAELQQDSLAEMQTYSTEFDISKMVESARAHVHHENLTVALLRFALGYNLTDCEELKKTVLKAANDFPMQHLFGASIVDQKGRVIKQKPGLFRLQGQELENRLKEEMFAHASQFMWSVRVSSYIDPGRLQIYNDHHPSFEDLLFLVVNNPFVPHGHEGIFLRGIHAGFHGDFLIAAHLLVPQIENSLRFVLESHGVDVSNLKSDGTQPVKVLGAIFDLKETTEIFGESLCFELRGCLIEKMGYDFRNHLAHGFVSEGECFSAAALHIWWMVLRICLLPIYQQLTQQKGEYPPNPADEESRVGDKS